MGQADPVVVIVEDLHWAQPALLAVLEEICDWSRDAAIMVLGLARPEFLDDRPQWGGGKLNATSVLLTPLEDDVCEALLRELLDGGVLPVAASRQVIKAAGGNPLFLEQLLSMLLDDGSFECHEGEWRVARELDEIPVPPSISALLAARLDRLNAEERQVLESASVVGQSFYAGAVAELSGLLPAAVAGATRSLMRKELVRRAPSDISGEEGLAFTHVLVADAAYLSVPKRRRADLHERFARWFDKHQSATIGDVDEFVGHHLMQAVQLRRELGRLGPSDRELAVQGAQRLASAARRQRLTDSVAAAQLFGRAAELRDGEPEGIELRRCQGAELLASQAFADARGLLEQCLGAAEAVQDPGLLARVRLTWIEAALHTEPRVEYDRCEELVESAVHEIDPDDDESFVMVYRARQRLLNLRSLWDEMVVTAEGIMFHASRSGDKASYDEAYGFRLASLMYGTRPVSELMAELDRADDDDLDPGGVYRFYRRMIRLVLLAYEDRFDEVHQMLAELEDGAKTVRARWVLAHFDFMQVLTHLVLGDDAALEQVTRRMITEMESAGELSLLSTLAPILGEVMVRRGELDEAWSLAETGRLLAMAEDADSQAQWRSIEATVWATRGQHVEAQRLADEAVALMETTQHVDWIAQTFVTRARIHELAGRSGEAVEDLDRAIRIFGAKGNIPGGRRARQQRQTLRASP
jgi:tetratricopeptide (TPR) repeat protein